MERYEIVVDDEGNYCGLIPSENGPLVQYAYAQATIAELTKQVEGLEQGCSIHHVDKDQADATIAALQARVEAHERAYQEGHPTPCTLGSYCPYCEIERRVAQLTQRTAELEAAKADKAKWEDIAGLRFAGDHKFVKEMELLKVENANLQAELERVRGERDRALELRDRWQAQLDKEQADSFMRNIELVKLRALVRALPKVEFRCEVDEKRDPEDDMFPMYGYTGSECHGTFAAFQSKETAQAVAAILQHRQGMEG